MDKEAEARQAQQQQQQQLPMVAMPPPQFGVPAATAVPVGVAGPMIQMTTLRPTLPVELWPHNFIVLSVILAISLGILNIFTLPLTVPACILGVMGHLQSKEGNYSSAKASSKVTIVLLIVAIFIFSLFWFSGWIPGLYFLTYFMYY